MQVGHVVHQVEEAGSSAAHTAAAAGGRLRKLALSTALTPIEVPVREASGRGVRRQSQPPTAAPVAARLPSMPSASSEEANLDQEQS